MSNSASHQVPPEMEAIEEDFSRIVEQFQKPVFNLCYRMTGNAEDAEDAAQETFWRAYKSISRYDSSRSFLTWLLSIAAHYCIDQIRKKKFATVGMDILPENDLTDPSPTPEIALNHSEMQAGIVELMNILSPIDRAAVVMRYWYDFSDEEIGQSLDLSVSAVKSRLHRARKTMATQWRQEDTQPLGMERRKNESPAL